MAKIAKALGVSITLPESGLNSIYMEKSPELKKPLEEDAEKNEAFEKIQEAQKNSLNIFIVHDLYPEFWKSKMDPLEINYGDVDVYFEYWYTAKNDKNPEDREKNMKEIPKDIRKTFQELEEFIKNKFPEEIYNQAAKIYDFFTNSRYVEKAYNIALKYLNSEGIQKAAKNLTEVALQTIKTTEDKKDAGKIAYRLLFDYLLDERKPGFEPKNEELEEVFKYLFGGIQYKAMEGDSIFKTFIYFIENKKVKPDQLLKEESAKNFCHHAAGQEIEKLLKRDWKKVAVEKANFYEKLGILNLGKDADLFDNLTKKK